MIANCGASSAADSGVSFAVSSSNGISSKLRSPWSADFNGLPRIERPPRSRTPAPPPSPDR